MMFTAKPPQITADENFLHQVRILAAKYNVQIKTNIKHRTLEILTDDETIKNTIIQELEEL